MKKIRVLKQVFPLCRGVKGGSFLLPEFRPTVHLVGFADEPEVAVTFRLFLFASPKLKFCK